MLSKEMILRLFHDLNEELSKNGITGEIGLVGGAAMTLAYNARTSTKDVDAVFKPSKEIRDAAKKVAEYHAIKEDWLNDAVKGFMPKNPSNQREILELPNLLVWTPEPHYLFAMKAIAARIDTKDKDDLIFLKNLIKIRSTEEAIHIVEKYYPNHQIPQKTLYFLEELFQEALT